MNKEELKELAATLNGIADGKAWESADSCYFSPVWEEYWSDDPISAIEKGYKIRLKPWSLPPPPDGMKWHRDDWTEEMLPEGYRPLLEGERIQSGDEGIASGVGFSLIRTCVGNLPGFQARTKRPLPQPDPYAELKAAHAAGKVIQFNPGDSLGWRDQQCDFTAEPHCYRIKPEQQKVPLEPSDVLPFCVFRFKGFNDLLTPFCVKDERVYFFSDTSHCWGYEWLMRNAEINRSIPLTGKWNPEAWEPCYKLIDTP
jgi:hypothetical protein